MKPAWHHQLARGAALGTSLGLASCSKPATESPSIAAASDLRYAFTEIGDDFAAQGGLKPVFTFGASGLLAKQLDQGAPFDVFGSASAGYVDEVVRSGACDGTTSVPFAFGRIVVWVRDALTRDAPKSLADLVDPRFRIISIANPEHAPYGRAAREALQHAGVWEAVKARLVFGENVQQALEFGRTGNADVAIVALSLAMASTGGSYVTVDANLHSPLEQVLVVCKHGRSFSQGKRFVDFVTGRGGRSILKKHGFLLPGDTEPPR
jgi:molybdate transport system substrate-binding protein